MKIDPADYWKLRALDADTALAQRQFQLVQERRQAFWAELVERHGLDASKNYRADDGTCSLEET